MAYRAGSANKHNPARRIRDQQGHGGGSPKSREEKGTQDDLTDLLREGAKRLIVEAVDAELSATLSEFDDYKGEAGHRDVVRKGHFPYEKG